MDLSFEYILLLIVSKSRGTSILLTSFGQLISKVSSLIFMVNLLLIL